MASTVRVIVVKDVLGREREEPRDVEAGSTLQELLEQVLEQAGVDLSGDSAPLRVLVGDISVSREWWSRVRPRAGQVVIVRPVAEATAVAAIATIAGYFAAAGAATAGAVGLGSVVGAIGSAAVAGAVGLGATGLAVGLTASVAVGIAGFAIGAAVSIGVSLAVRSIVGTPKNGGSQGSVGRAASPTLAGVGNQLRPGAPVVEVFGRHKIFPPLCGAVVTSTSGTKQFVHEILHLGPGPVDVSDIRVGGVPIGQIPGAEYEVRTGEAGDAPLGLYPRAVLQDFFNSVFPTARVGENRWSTPATHISPMGARRLGIDFHFPSGLVRLTDLGKDRDFTFRLLILYARVDPDGSQGAWKNAIQAASFGPYGGWGEVDTVDNNLLVFRGQTQQPFFRGFQWRVPDLEYSPDAKWAVWVQRWDVEPDTHLIDGPDTSAVLADCVWTSLKSYTDEIDPVKLEGQGLLALRLPLDQGTNGIVQQVSCIVQRKLPTWSPVSGWSPPVATRNRVWAICSVLRGGESPDPLLDDELNLPELYSVAQMLESEGDTFDHVRDYETTPDSLCEDIASDGLLSYVTVDGKRTLVSDRVQSQPTGFFSARNTWGFTWSHVYQDRPHAAVMQYVDSEDDFRPDGRVVVYDDGFSELGADGTQVATRFETIELVGATTRANAWKRGRYYLAANRLRPAIYSWQTGVEGIACRIGELVRVQHYSVLWGGGSGFVLDVEVDGNGDAIAITCDDTFTMKSGALYGVRIRQIAGGVLTSRALLIRTEPGDQRRLVFDQPVAADQIPQVGELVMFGERSLESVELIIKSIRYEAGPVPTVSLVAVDYSPAIYQAAEGPIPDFDPQITRPLPPGIARPPEPRILSIESNESVMLRTVSGQLVPRIMVTFAPSDGGLVRLAAYRVKWREGSTGTDWQMETVQLGQDRVFIENVRPGFSYDIGVQAIGENGNASDWTVVDGHVAIGGSTPPPDVIDLRLDPQTNVLRWSIPVHPIDLAGYLVRQHIGDVRSWENADPVHVGVVTTTNLYVGDFTGSRTFLVKAVDQAANESVSATFLVVGIGDTVSANVVETQDERSGGWAGTKTDCSVSSGDLVADDEPSLFWASADEDSFWAGDAVVFWDGLYKPMTYEFVVSPAVANVPGALTLQVEGQWGSISIEWAPDPGFWASDAAAFWESNTTPFWEVSELGYTAFPGRVEAFDRAHLFRVKLAGGALQGILEELVASIDVPDVSENFDDFVVAGTTGTRLTLTKTYRAIKRVRLALIDSGGTGISAKAVDKDETLGPLIQVLDATGAVVAGKVDVQVQGY